jgi:hypothetical protein
MPLEHLPYNCILFLEKINNENAPRIFAFGKKIYFSENPRGKPP